MILEGDAGAGVKFDRRNCHLSISYDVINEINFRHIFYPQYLSSVTFFPPGVHHPHGSKKLAMAGDYVVPYPVFLPFLSLSQKGSVRDLVLRLARSHLFYASAVVGMLKNVLSMDGTVLLVEEDLKSDQVGACYG